MRDYSFLCIYNQSSTDDTEHQYYVSFKHGVNIMNIFIYGNREDIIDVIPKEDIISRGNGKLTWEVDDSNDNKIVVKLFIKAAPGSADHISWYQDRLNEFAKYPLEKVNVILNGNDLSSYLRMDIIPGDKENLEPDEEHLDLNDLKDIVMDIENRFKDSVL